MFLLKLFILIKRKNKDILKKYEILFDRDQGVYNDDPVATS